MDTDKPAIHVQIKLEFGRKENWRTCRKPLYNNKLNPQFFPLVGGIQKFVSTAYIFYINRQAKQQHICLTVSAHSSAMWHTVYCSVTTSSLTKLCVREGVALRWAEHDMQGKVCHAWLGQVCVLQRVIEF